MADADHPLIGATPDIVLASAQFLGTLTFGAVVAPFGWVTPTWVHLGLFFASGAISVCALLCVNRSLKFAQASTVAPYQYAMIVWAVIFGYVVFGDVPQAHTALGAAIIIAAGLYIFLASGNSGDRNAGQPARLRAR